MSATVGFKRWEPVETETDAQVKHTISTTATALSNPPSDATAVRLIFEKNEASEGGDSPIVRSYRHGTDPTASNGKPHFNGEERDIFGRKDIRDTKFISADGNDHIIYCQWIKTF